MLTRKKSYMYKCKLCGNVFIRHKSARLHVRHTHNIAREDADDYIAPFDIPTEYEVEA